MIAALWGEHPIGDAWPSGAFQAPQKHRPRIEIGVGRNPAKQIGEDDGQLDSGSGSGTNQAVIQRLMAGFASVLAHQSAWGTVGGARNISYGGRLTPGVSIFGSTRDYSFQRILPFKWLPTRLKPDKPVII